MEQTSRDRLIEAWREFIKENKIPMIMDACEAGWRVDFERYLYSENTVGKVYCSVDVIGARNISVLLKLFRDMLKSLQN